LFILGKPFSLSRKFIASTFADPVASASVIDALTLRQFIESPCALKEMLLSQIVVDPDRITCPMLVVRAAKDRAIHPDVAGEVAAYYGASLTTLHDLGHMCIMEAGWERTAAAILSWLSNNIKT